MDVSSRLAIRSYPSQDPYASVVVVVCNVSVISSISIIVICNVVINTASITLVVPKRWLVDNNSPPVNDVG